MLPIQPTNIWHYLDWQPLIIPPTLHHQFYASWEDALWQLIVYFQLAQDSITLVPDFFCGDVISNMQSHGLKPIFYNVDQFLRTDPYYFANQLKEIQPSVVVIFNAVGITNQLWNQKEVWLPHLPKNCLLIEDCVHRVVDPNTISLLTSRHIVIDSLRKVVPIPGANLYIDSQFSTLKAPENTNHRYSFLVIGWWLAFQLCLLFSQILPIRTWWLFWNKLAEKSMLIGYDYIGDSPTSTAGWWWAKKIAKHLSPKKISTSKIKQVNQYQKMMATLLTIPNIHFFAIPFSKNDTGLLRGFPVGLKIDSAEKTLTELRQKGLLLRFELNDSPWSEKYKIIYLPLGPHLNQNQVDWACQTMLTVAKDNS